MSNKQTWTLFDDVRPRQVAQADSLPASVVTKAGTFKLSWQTLSHGPSAGVDLLTITGERAGFVLVPTRGMGIWRAWCDQWDFGWQSPVQGPVHPSLVPWHDSSGIGWLEGFDELLVRCGLESNGAPEFTDSGQVRWPLHGRVANLPASKLSITIDLDSGELEVTGVVRESRLFFTALELTSTVKFSAGGHVISINDRVTNLRGQPATHQLLYHLNVGQPILGPQAKLIVSASEVAPRDVRAQVDIDSWELYKAPEPGYAEQVYFFKPNADAAGWSRAALIQADEQAGFGVVFNTQTLPCFVQWKNTAAVADGYVTGLEPATNFPNPRSFEEKQGRLVQLAAGASVEHQLQLHLLSGHEATAHFCASIHQLGTAPQVHRQPKAGWSGS